MKPIPSSCSHSGRPLLPGPLKTGLSISSSPPGGMSLTSPGSVFETSGVEDAAFHVNCAHNCACNKSCAVQQLVCCILLMCWEWPMGVKTLLQPQHWIVAEDMVGMRGTQWVGGPYISKTNVSINTEQFQVKYSPILPIPCAHTCMHTFLSILVHLPLSIMLFFVFFSYLLSMVPHMRCAQKTVGNHAEGGLNGSNVSLGHATGLDVNSVNIASQSVLHDQTPTNLKGEFKTSCQA